MDDKKDTILLFTSIKEPVSAMTDEEAGKLFKAILAYQTGENVNLEGLMNVVFLQIKQQIDYANIRYAEISKKRSEARKKKLEEKQNETNDNKTEQNTTKENKSEQIETNRSYNDNENGNDNDNDNENVNVNENNINVIHNSVCYTRAPEEGQGSDFKIYGICNNVRLTDDEMNELKKMYPTLFGDYIDRVSLHKKSEGREYNDDFATILKWIRKDKDKQKAQRKEDCINDTSQYGDDTGLFESFKTALDDASSE